MATTTLPRPKAYDDTFFKPISLWLTTTDHKLIGIMYMVTSLISFVIGGIFALIIRLQLSQPNLRIVDAETYNQLISAHGVTMIFFFVTIFVTGIANYMVPIMIGARDMAFPRVNLLGFWLIPVSIILYYCGFLTGGSLNAGWTGYAPLTEKAFQGHSLGVDFWAMSIIVWAISGIMASTNFLTTIVALRATGIKFFNWIATAWWGSVEFTVPMKFVFGFLATFLIGGITGIYLASVPVDTQLHQSYYVVAHLHYVLFGGSVFGILAGIYYWFPKITGRLLNRTLGEWNFWTVFVGFNGTFLIMHTLGLEGMPRRIWTYANPAWATTNVIITISSFLIAFSILVLLINVVHSWGHGEIAGNDPWRGNTLEWATTSPPPPYNFERVPPVRSFMPVRDLRESGELIEAEPVLTPT